jgi:hypothetical protein
MRRAEHLSFQSGCPLKMKDIVRHKDLGEGKVVGLPDKGVEPEAHNYNKAWVHFIKDQTKLWVTWSSLKIITAQAATKRVADRELVCPPRPNHCHPTLRTVAFWPHSVSLTPCSHFCGPGAAHRAAEALRNLTCRS